ncbi:hypothetical protein [Haloglomus halophilum]|jgi:hypothetical protein|uniref:hypothetical protein n=1 Tax=Haloglomus halophilum TaxID=2962672 RepID=UPI0020C9D857|nr:hypothetical protein [Haloglomus halophilum]
MGEGDWSAEVFTLIEEQEFLEASDLLVEQSFCTVVQQECNPWTDGGVAIGYLLHALACTVRAGDERRARFIQTTIEAWSRHAKEEADEVWHEAFLGTAEEWIGDSYLLMKSEDAEDHYQLAREHFERAKVDGTLTWAGEHWSLPAGSAYKVFLQGEGVSAGADSQLRSSRFEDRLDEKQRLVTEIIR